MTKKTPPKHDPSFSLPINGRWLTRTRSDLEAAIHEGGDREREANLFREHWKRFQDNHLAYFLPHGPIVVKKDVVGDITKCVYRRDTKPHTGPGTSGAEFINDRHNHLKMMLKINQGGGTCHGAAAILFKNIYCDPDWPCFHGNGIDYYPWTGPKDVLIAAYTWEKIGDTLWPEYLKLMPEREKTPYMQTLDVQRFVGGKVRTCQTAYSHTKFHFKCYQQSQTTYSGMQFDDMHLDEQSKENQFREAWRGVSSRIKDTGIVIPQCLFTLTGHMVDGHPDTGGGGWLKTALYDGRDTYGCKVGVYKISLASVPIEIMSKTVKRQKMQDLENARAHQDMVKVRELEARVLGGWEVGGGLVFDEFDPKFNLIDHTKIPEVLWRSRTLYRAIDPGKNKPTACLWLAVLKTGDIVCYREYYTRGLGVPRTAADIVKASGNVALLDKTYHDEYYKTTIQYHHEEFIGERYADSLLDGRTFATNSDSGGMTIGELYQAAGLECRAAPGAQDSLHRPTLESKGGILYVINEGFRKQEKRKHVVTGKEGGCKIWVDYRLKYLIDEVSMWRLIRSNTTGEERPDPKQPNHLIDCLKYIMAINPYCDTRERGREEVEYRVPRHKPKRWGRGQFVS